MREIEITTKDAHSLHGEQIVRTGIARDEKLVARIDGVVAGRMVLESVWKYLRNNTSRGSVHRFYWVDTNTKVSTRIPLTPD